MKPATLRDIAVRTHLDITVVSRMLNDAATAPFAPELREQILRAADELGCAPRRSTHALRLNRPHNVGYVLTDPGFHLARLLLLGRARVAPRRRAQRRP